MSKDTPDSAAVAASQSGAAPLTVFAAPATGDEFNTIGERLVPKGCFKVEDLLFEFASSFVRPEIGVHLPKLAQLRAANKIKDPGTGADIFPPLSIFGHADPVSNDDFNKQLSGRRATAIYAMLVRDIDLWEHLFSNPLGDDNWGTRSLQTMLSTVQQPLTIDGVNGDETSAAVRDFQGAQGLSVDGKAGLLTRKALFRAYMDALCGSNLELDKTRDFLARNQDKAGKGDFQGCGEFNPVILFSQAEAAAFGRTADKAARNRENAPNRRVMILLFAPGRRVNPAVWPCPRASEGTAACKKRFFPDAADRRSFQAERREFETTNDTFACRFYQIISDDSPCERVKPLPVPPPLVEVQPLIFVGRAGAATVSSFSDSVTAITGRNFVFVKRAYTKPARVPVTLKADRPFDGTGKFTFLDKGNLRFFPDQDSLLVMRFDDVQNVFTGVQLTAGVTVFAEALKGSDAIDDITLTLVLSPNLATIASATRAQMTAVEVTLDIAAPRPSSGAEPVPLPQPTTATAPPGNPRDKLFGGRFVHLQDVQKTQERAMLLVRIKPAAFDTSLLLRRNETLVNIFNSENPKSADPALTGPIIIPTTTMTGGVKRLFVEGKAVSSTLRDAPFQLEIDGVEPEGDRASATVIVATVRVLGSDNVEIPARESLQCSNFVTTDQLPTANTFAGTSTDPDNFRIELEHFPVVAPPVRADIDILRTGTRQVGPLTHDLIQGTGADSRKFRSRFLRLVTDTDDDAASGNGATSDPDRQTILARLADVVRTTFHSPSGKDVVLDFPVGRPPAENDNGANGRLHDIREVKVNVVVFRSGPGPGPALTRAQVQTHLDNANERLAQSCLRLNVVVFNMGGAGDPGVPLPAALAGGFTMSPGVITAYNASEQAVIALKSSDANAIDIFFVNTITNSPRAESYPAARNGTPNAAQKNFVVVASAATALSLGHEMLHILLNSPHRANEPLTSLFRGGTTPNKIVGGTKRIGPYPQAAAVAVGNADTTTVRNNAETLP